MPKENQPKIRSVYNPSDSEKDRIKMVYDRKRRMQEGRQTYMGRINLETEWDRQERLVEAWRAEKNPDDWRSD